MGVSCSAQFRDDGGVNIFLSGSQMNIRHDYLNDIGAEIHFFISDKISVNYSISVQDRFVHIPIAAAIFIPIPEGIRYSFLHVY